MSEQETQETPDFAALLESEEQTAAQTPEPSQGDMVKGTIVSIGDDMVFVDLGSKAEATIPRAEVTDASGKLLVKAGDSIEAMVMGTDPDTGGFVLRRKIGGKVKRSSEVGPEVRQAFESGVPVEGVVTTINKGGAEIQLFGMRAFCPLSQLDLRYTAEPQQYVGQRLSFRISRLEEGRGSRGPNIVLSRRALLEEEQKARAAETREHVKPGAVLKGKVTSITSYGVFVDLGGLEGMLHVSEIGHSRTAHPQDVFSMGQEVEVQVLKVERGKDEKRDRISLSRRALERDPWRDAAARFPEGAELDGRVMRLESFGAFVELAPGIEGLVHISEIGAGKRLNHAREAVQLGQDVKVKVLGVDTGKRRISLSMAAVGGGGKARDREEAEHAASYRQAAGSASSAGSSGSSGSGFGSMADFFRVSRQRG